MDSRQITVIGSSQPGETEYEQAYNVGYLLGQQGITVVSGGGEGVMEMASKGAQDSGHGRAVGILKTTDPSSGNPYLDTRIATGTGEARNLAVVSSGDAVIAIGGRFGTLTELGYAMKQEKPVFGIGTWSHETFSFPSDLTPQQAVKRALEVLDSSCPSNE